MTATGEFSCWKFIFHEVHRVLTDGVGCVCECDMDVVVWLKSLSGCCVLWNIIWLFSSQMPCEICTRHGIFVVKHNTVSQQENSSTASMNIMKSSENKLFLTWVATSRAAHSRIKNRNSQVWCDVVECGCEDVITWRVWCCVSYSKIALLICWRTWTVKDTFEYYSMSLLPSESSRSGLSSEIKDTFLSTFALK